MVLVGVLMRYSAALFALGLCLLPIQASAFSQKVADKAELTVPRYSPLCDGFCNDMDGDGSGVTCAKFCITINDPIPVYAAVCGIAPSLDDPKSLVCTCRCVTWDELPPQVASEAKSS